MVSQKPESIATRKGIQGLQNTSPRPFFLVQDLNPFKKGSSMEIKTLHLYGQSVDLFATQAHSPIFNSAILRTTLRLQVASYFCSPYSLGRNSLRTQEALGTIRSNCSIKQCAFSQKEEVGNSWIASLSKLTNHLLTYIFV